MTMLELQYVSQKLLSARSLELAVPGTYRVNGAMVRIRHFLPTVQVHELIYTQY
jgi:serine/threonine-protein kinase mTOR